MGAGFEASHHRGLARPASDVIGFPAQRLEHARAVRERIGVDVFMDYVDTMATDMSTDWQRIVFATPL